MRTWPLFFLLFFVFPLLSQENLVPDDIKTPTKEEVSSTPERNLSLIETYPERRISTELDWKGWFTIALFVLTFIALIKEVRTPDVILLISAGILVIVGILTPRQFLEGFSNPVLVTIAMLCIVVRAMENNGILEVVGQKILASSKNIPKQLISYMVPVSFASAFLNNTPIVLLMTPIVRNWALKRDLKPSKYLIPLSYAAIFGGMCTLIGTSTNIVVAGLLTAHSPASAITFFELGKVGLVLAAAGTFYMSFIGRHLLPARQDPTVALTKQMQDFTMEFLVKEECSLIGKTIKEAGRKYFPEEMLVQIERGDETIDSPSRDFVIFQNDRLVFAGEMNKIVQLHTIKKLQSLADPHFKFDPDSSHFSEVVLSTTSWLAGKTPKQINFRTNYAASVIAIYREGQRVKENVGDTVLQPGDTLMLLSRETWHGADYYNKDFYNIRHAEKLPIFNLGRALLILAIMLAMVVAIMMHVSMVVATFAAAFALVFTKSISIRQAQKSIVWNILLLIACAFALANAMVVTGVASYFAEILLTIVGTKPYALMAGILFITIVATELLSNNAAALIIFPIAVQAAFLAGYNSDAAAKAIGITVAIGCSTCFAIPTGYQTHMIVFGPGGYKFLDFLKVGLPLDLIFLILGTLLIPLFWPLVP